MEAYRELEPLGAEECPDDERQGACDGAPGDDLGDDLDVADAFGEHDIEYWVRHGNRLVPASADEIAHIQEFERELAAYLRLESWQRDERRAQRWPIRFLRRTLARREAWVKRAPHHDSTRVTNP